MNILLISQCKKNALKETRRIIDQFAERCGDRTWQTVITQAGLQTLHTLLRRTARKNSAIACYWTHGNNRTELLWIVGDRRAFNEHGRVPTHRSKRNLFSHDDENRWHNQQAIQIVATLAALLHDLGKASLGFQEKLQHSRDPSFKKTADPYRHEWISLHLFRLMVEGCKSDEAVLHRLAHFAEYQTQNPSWHTQLAKVEKHTLPLHKQPAIVQWLGWLIVSHHRMPLTQDDERFLSSGHFVNWTSSTLMKKWREEKYTNEFRPERFFAELQAVSNWVSNPTSQHRSPLDFWQLKQSVTESPVWLSYLKRWANKARKDTHLLCLLANNGSHDPFLLHLSRLALMTGDHNFSSAECRHPNGLNANNEMIANTLRGDVQMDDKGHPCLGKQRLDEHLIGVATATARFAHNLSVLPSALPSLLHVVGLSKNTTNAEFLWQNRSYQLAKGYAEKANSVGFFGVNMASTGCGKTLANARIMSALADAKRGLRLTIALGLRVLTLQTGRSLRDKLKLDDTQLAILVGGEASRQLFAIQEEAKAAAAQQSAVNMQENYAAEINLTGDESSDELIAGTVDVAESALDDAQFGTLIDDARAKALLMTPMVTCTVDHIIQASESRRGGRHIVPQLRLLTSDLILDEPDDFDHHDLPALARLVYLAGLFGSKVLLSSATLTPDLLCGLFSAYAAGRRIWQRQHQQPDMPIVCGWFDEFQQTITEIASASGSQSSECDSDFAQQHQRFVSQRVKQLLAQTVRRRATIMPLVDYSIAKQGARSSKTPVSVPLEFENCTLNMLKLAHDIKAQAYQLHTLHHTAHPKTDQRVSVGLVRLAHTRQVIDLAKAMYYADELPDDTALHIVVYHARQLLLLRSKVEERLDAILCRHDPQAIFAQPDIAAALAVNPAKQHIFMVIGTPVTEVGRDHDYDWAIIEPSSMRSIIQLVGRVWRHRPEKKADQPNVVILPSNLIALAKGNGLGRREACFTRPGFEVNGLLLPSHKSEDILTPAQLSHITAQARIERPMDSDETLQTLAELEHRMMAIVFNTQPKPDRAANAVTSYWQAELAHAYCVHLQTITPFRRSQPEEDYFCTLDDAGKYQFRHLVTADNYHLDTQRHTLSTVSYQDWTPLLSRQKNITPWLTADLAEQLSALNNGHYARMSLSCLAARFAVVSLPDRAQWYYHPWFGFYEHPVITRPKRSL